MTLRAVRRAAPEAPGRSSPSRRGGIEHRKVGTDVLQLVPGFNEPVHVPGCAQGTGCSRGGVSDGWIVQLQGHRHVGLAWNGEALPGVRRFWSTSNASISSIRAASTASSVPTRSSLTSKLTQALSSATATGRFPAASYLPSQVSSGMFGTLRLPQCAGGRVRRRFGPLWSG